MEETVTNVEDEQGVDYLEWDEWSTKRLATVKIGGRYFQIQELDGDQLDAISKIPRPTPPMKYKAGPDGKPLRGKELGKTEPDLDDPVYVKELQLYQKTWALKLLEYGLVKPNGQNIPGKNIEEKWEFLKKGSAGNTSKLIEQIVSLSSLKEQDVDFFDLG